MFGVCFYRGLAAVFCLFVWLGLFGFFEELYPYMQAALPVEGFYLNYGEFLYFL